MFEKRLSQSTQIRKLTVKLRYRWIGRLFRVDEEDTTKVGLRMELGPAICDSLLRLDAIVWSLVDGKLLEAVEAAIELAMASTVVERFGGCRLSCWRSVFTRFTCNNRLVLACLSNSSRMNDFSCFCSFDDSFGFSFVASLCLEIRGINRLLINFSDKIS